MSRKHHSVHSGSLGGAATASATKSRAARVQPASSQASPDQNRSATSTAEQWIDPAAIARLAYSYWEARGYTNGSPEEDWLRAEQELRARQAASAVA